jgi:COP9 signalosome complex subunit 5
MVSMIYIPANTDPHSYLLILSSQVIHARSGGQYEIMGVMTGKIKDRAFIVMDTFALPVQGTETRVNAGDAATEYMVTYKEGNEEVGKNELVVGWYHRCVPHRTRGLGIRADVSNDSHPGYGCWLSGIDVNTQSSNQAFNDPYLAVVVSTVRKPHPNEKD